MSIPSEYSFVRFNTFDGQDVIISHDHIVSIESVDHLPSSEFGYVVTTVQHRSNQGYYVSAEVGKVLISRFDVHIMDLRSKSVDQGYK